MRSDQLIDHLIHVAEILPLLVLVWRVTRKVSRFVDVMFDFPPHRHTNGDIFYPRDFSPGKTEHRRSVHSEEP